MSSKRLGTEILQGLGSFFSQPKSEDARVLAPKMALCPSPVS